MVTAFNRFDKVSSDYLITLAVVAETRNLSEAAQLLGLSQPAVSQQLKSLSSAVGERLHRRSPHGVALTSAGEALAQQCGTLLRGYRSALEYLEALVQGDAGVLSVAASNTVAAYVLPHWLIEYRRSYNGVRIAARSTNSELVVAALHDGEVEIGLVEMPELNPGRGFVAHPIGGDELVLVCSPKLAQFPTREVDWDEIRELPLVTREYGSGVRAVVERALSAARYRPEQVIELAGGEAVREAILAGLGIGFLSSLAVVRDVAEGLLVPLTLRGLGHLQRGFRVFSKPFDELSIPARNFLTLVTR